MRRKECEGKEREPVRLSNWLRWSRYLFLGVGVAFFLWKLSEVLWSPKDLDFWAISEISLVTVVGPGFVWLASTLGEKLAQQVEQRSNELLALNQLTQRVLEQMTDLMSKMEGAQRLCRMLIAVNQAVNQRLPPEQIIDHMLDLVLEGMSMDTGEIWLMAPSRDKLRFFSRRGLLPEAFSERNEFALGDGFPGIAAQSRQPVFTNDLSHESHFLRRAVVSAGFISFGAIPIFGGGKIIGVLTIASRRIQVPSPTEVEAILNLTQSMTPLFLQLLNSRKNDKLAERDG